MMCDSNEPNASIKIERQGELYVVSPTPEQYAKMILAIMAVELGVSWQHTPLDSDELVKLFGLIEFVDSKPILTVQGKLMRDHVINAAEEVL